MSSDSKPEPTTPTKGPQIYAALNACMREVGHIGKDRQPKSGVKFNFRGVDDVYLALQPLFSKHGVVAMPRVLDSQYSEVKTKNGGVQTYCRMKVEYTFYALDGSHVVAVTAGEAQDTSDKSTPKAMSIAYKYAMFQVLAIPCEEVHNDWDPDFTKDDRTAPDAQDPQPAGGPTNAQLDEMDKLILDINGGNADEAKSYERNIALWVSDDVTDRIDRLTPEEADKAIASMRVRLRTMKDAASEKGAADTRNQQQPANAGRGN